MTLQIPASWEDEALLPLQCAAESRLAAAVKAERRTSSLPPGYTERDEALQELRWAQAVVAELGA